MNPRAEEVRIRYLYRTLILKGHLRLPLEAARALVGPDCAYHLYRVCPESPRPPSSVLEDQRAANDSKGS